MLVFSLYLAVLFPKQNSLYITLFTLRNIKFTERKNKSLIILKNLLNYYVYATRLIFPLERYKPKKFEVYMLL